MWGLPAICQDNIFMFSIFNPDPKKSNLCFLALSLFVSAPWNILCRINVCTLYTNMFQLSNAI